MWQPGVVTLPIEKPHKAGGAGSRRIVWRSPRDIRLVTSIKFQGVAEGVFANKYWKFNRFKRAARIISVEFPQGTTQASPHYSTTRKYF
jgi:hypothetical protein